MWGEALSGDRATLRGDDVSLEASLFDKDIFRLGTCKVYHGVSYARFLIS